MTFLSNGTAPESTPVPELVDALHEYMANAGPLRDEVGHGRVGECGSVGGGA
jgi:hypothetical protein